MVVAFLQFQFINSIERREVLGQYLYLVMELLGPFSSCIKSANRISGIYIRIFYFIQCSGHFFCFGSKFPGNLDSITYICHTTNRGVQLLEAIAKALQSSTTCAK